MEKVKATYDGAIRSLNHRNLSPSTQQILRLLAAKAEEAMRKGQAGIDHEALLKDISEIKIPNAKAKEALRKDKAEIDHEALLHDISEIKSPNDYVEKRTTDIEGRGGEFFFRKLMWININETLKEENEREGEWSRQDSRGERPQKPIHDEIEQALEKIGESDYAQGYWVINFYAARNEAVYSNILDDRLRGDYEKVLETVQKDIQYLVDLLANDTSDDYRHCLDLCLHFRATWFEQKSSANGITWQPNLRAQNHLKEIAQRERNLGLARNRI
ncbi:MAG: hypothetical protein Q9195_009481 [Heterodermia aff. obscurata]